MIRLFVIDFFFNLPFRSKLWKLYIVLYEDSEVFGNVYRGWIGPEKKNRKSFNTQHGSNCFVFWSRIFVLFGPSVRFHIISSVRVTEWPPIG